MSEYWKSTPKYWCKNCSTYVRDTPFERRQHESTAKHQGNLKRFLRDIQNDHERTAREKQKAKDEVDRLNKLTGSGALQPAASASAPTIRKPTTSALTADDQKRQWSQLSEMGIQVPNTYGGEMAMASNWNVISKPKAEEAEEDSLSKGVRKRKLDEGEEEEEIFVDTTRKAWGKATKNYPGQDTTDLDALLSGHLPLKKERPEISEENLALAQTGRHSSPTAIKSESLDTAKSDAGTPHQGKTEGVGNVREGANVVLEEATNENGPLVKQEQTEGDGETTIHQPTPTPVFKRRKNKASSDSQVT